MNEDDTKKSEEGESFAAMREQLEEGMKRMSDTLKKDEEETQALWQQTAALLSRVTEVKKKVEEGVAELRASMEVWPPGMPCGGDGVC